MYRERAKQFAKQIPKPKIKNEIVVNEKTIPADDDDYDDSYMRRDDEYGQCHEKASKLQVSINVYMYIYVYLYILICMCVFFLYTYMCVYI
jgi:hypothetical protein